MQMTAAENRRGVGPWFRLYEEILDDPKVQRLPDALFKAWVNLLCVASRFEGELPPIGDLAFLLRTTEAEAADRIEKLVAAGLLDRDGGGLIPHNWARRQFKSDHSAPRVRKHREARAAADGASDVTACNADDAVTVTADVTPPESESETESLPSGRVRARGARRPPREGERKRVRGSPLPDDWQPPPERYADAVKRLGRERAADLLVKFSGYYRSTTGRAVSRDWNAAWTNWVIREGEFARAPPAATNLRAAENRKLEEIIALGERTERGRSESLPGALS